MATPAEDDWIELYRATLRPLYAFVARRAGERALAEDVTQEAWLRAVSSWRGRGLPRDPLRWLERVAHNLLRNHFRRLRPATIEGEELALESAELGSSSPSARALLQWGLARLPSRRAELVCAHHLDGKSLAQIAAETGASERAVEGRLRRARQALQRVLSPHLGPEGDRS